MIRIGLTNKEKETVINDYVERHNIKKVIVFSPPRFQAEFSCSAPVVYHTWDDVILYRVFYPLLEEIGSDHLIVCNEMLRKKNRSELTYNCMHHYQNQTPHRITFEYFPFIDDNNDFMILADFEHPGRYKGQSYDPFIVKDMDVLCKRHHMTAGRIVVSVPDDVQSAYQKEKESLFESLGRKDPETIPRALHLWCGKFKASIMSSNALYVARNARYKRDNVLTYKQINAPGSYVLADFPHARIDLNDFLKVSGMEHLDYLTTLLPIDMYYESALNEWIGRLEAFYAQTGIYQ